MSSKSFIYSLIFFSLIFQTAAQEMQPSEKEVLVEVSVFDNSKKIMKGETVTFFGRRTRMTYSVETDGNGKALLMLPKRDVYEVSYKDLLTQKDYALLEVPDEPGLFTYSVEIEYEPSRVFVLENVYFEFAKSVLKTESFPALDELVALLKAEPEMEIEISGHTDNIGSSESNMKLSKDRAESVRQYLIRKGIEPRRVKSVGYGDTMPVATNETDEGRQLNRRTEVKILNR
jgi:outer membrane protein OmpA-like peptidoglycan-associated protein